MLKGKKTVNPIVYTQGKYPSRTKAKTFSDKGKLCCYQQISTDLMLRIISGSKEMTTEKNFDLQERIKNN